MEDDIFRQGVAAAKTGDLETACKYFGQFVKQNPQSENGWLALGACLSEVEMKELCFKKVLSLNPENEKAKQLLQGLKKPQVSGPEIIKDSVETPDEEDGVRFEWLKKIPSMPALIGFFMGLFVVGGLLLYIVNKNPPAIFDEFVRAIIHPPSEINQSVQATETSMAGLTLTHTPTQIISPGVTSVQTPTLSSSLSLTQRFIENDDKINLAFQHMEDGNLGEAILLWDEIIEAMPEYAHAYYARGVSYYYMTSHEHYLDVYREYSENAYIDITKAIELSPDNGNYYSARVDAIESLAGIKEFRDDYLLLYQDALDDILKAYELGNSYAWGTRAVGTALINAGYCEESLDYFLRLTKEREENGESPSPSINARIANAYLCLEEYQKALEYNSLSISILDDMGESTEIEKRHRVWILTALNRYQEALEIINEILEKDPYYQGGRYYDRALIHYMMGNTDLAYEDITYGSTQTWGKYGIRAYVLGLLALDNGNKEDGLYWLQLAEASIAKINFPHIYAQTLEEIDKLGGTLLYPTPTPSPTLAVSPTPIPVIADHVYSTPTPPAPISQPDLANYFGTGIIYMDPEGELVILFRPPGYHDFHQIEALAVYLSGQELEKGTLLELTLLQLDGADGEVIQLSKGENMISNPEKYVDSAGYFHATLRNFSAQPIVIENVSVQLVVKNQDGTEEIYGYQ